MQVGSIGSSCETVKFEAPNQEESHITNVLRTYVGREWTQTEEARLRESVLKMKVAAQALKGIEQTFVEEGVPVHRIIDQIYLGSEAYLRALLKRTSLGGYPEGFNPKKIITLNFIEFMGERDFDALREFAGIDHIYVPIEDSPEGFECFIPTFPKIMGEFCEALLSGEGMLIQCKMGRSRSAAAAAMCIAKIAKLTFDEANALLRSIRSEVSRPMPIFPEGYYEYTGTVPFTWCAKQYCDANFV